MNYKRMILIFALSIVFGMAGCDNKNLDVESKDSLDTNFDQKTYETKIYIENMHEESVDMDNETDAAEAEGKDKKSNNEIDFIEFGVEVGEFDGMIKKEVELGANSYIDQIKWITDEQTLLRVSVCNKESENDLDILHKEDYFFYKRDDSIDFIKVDYSFDFDLEERMVWMNPTFDCQMVDVTFDGKDDLLIDLGLDGMSEMKVFCAYIYTENGYQYCSSFEKIRNFRVNPDKHVIESHIQGDYIDYYQYEKENFVLVNKE